MGKRRQKTTGWSAGHAALRRGPTPRVGAAPRVAEIVLWVASAPCVAGLQGGICEERADRRFCTRLALVPPPRAGAVAATAAAAAAAAAEAAVVPAAASADEAGPVAESSPCADGAAVTPLQAEQAQGSDARGCVLGGSDGSQHAAQEEVAHLLQALASRDAKPALAGSWTATRIPARERREIDAKLSQL